MSDVVHPNVARVVEAGRALGLAIVTRRFPEGTKTAQDAATAIGVEVWAAAGTWNDVFPITPNDLVRASAGVVTDLKRA
ncbi:MAG: hypothetical protein EBZ88_05350 [Actinobacteria bacterium]|nr:hypothetical protein [Actinomycetota bacterium]